MIFLIKKIMEYLLVTACVLVYIKVGPGGEHVEKIVNEISKVLLSIDWGDLDQKISHEIELIFQSVGNYITNR
ncbi:MAG: hypothetical protein KZQ70_09945 [gamma proteobacterium symbiont of Lucinoma myriamae]|nr:hypothetical protein [gamma proteobacterium symbiont of Lucinoma myriamae]MCU7819758.1 hypothetical protein [gamma proteobacterium symbiont of Lucinoma myriamae]